MIHAQAGDTVQVHYTGKLDDGTVFDSSMGGKPIEFTLGANQVIDGFERGVLGMAVGDTKTIIIPADQAYGPYHDELVLVLERSRFPEHLTPQVGQMLQLQRPDGEPIEAMITEVSDEFVTMDANHPLAGEQLTFDLELMHIA